MTVPKLGSSTTADDVLKAFNADLKGKHAIVTGGNSGIGEETVRALSSAGARVVLCARNVALGEEAAARVKKAVPKADLRVMKLDLADLKSVDDFSKEYAASESGAPDLLVLNAGVMAIPKKETTKQGLEMQFGTNHVGHFRLTNNLLPRMKEGGVPRRVVAVSSEAHKMGGFDINDLNFEKRAYGAWSSYGQSKLSNVLFAKELSSRLEGTKVSAFSLHPGVIHTNLQRHMWGASILAPIFSLFLKSIPQGAATTVYACVAPGLESQSGSYLKNCAVSQPIKEGRDADLARQLWDKTEAMLAALPKF